MLIISQLLGGGERGECELSFLWIHRLVFYTEVCRNYLTEYIARKKCLHSQNEDSGTIVLYVEEVPLFMDPCTSLK